MMCVETVSEFVNENDAVFSVADTGLMLMRTDVMAAALRLKKRNLSPFLQPEQRVCVY